MAFNHEFTLFFADYDMCIKKVESILPFFMVKSYSNRIGCLNIYTINPPKVNTLILLF